MKLALDVNCPKKAKIKLNLKIKRLITISIIIIITCNANVVCYVNVIVVSRGMLIKCMYVDGTPYNV